MRSRLQSPVSVCKYLVLVALALPLSAATEDLSLNAQLLAAARNGDETAVARSLERGAAPDSRNRSGDTTLLIACTKGLTGMARLVIERGANINQPNLDGVTPLMAAAHGGHKELPRCCWPAMPN
jgi:ankyrin repeat protein